MSATCRQFCGIDCDGELISYQTATLTAAYHYGLTYLRRGAYDTPVNAHSAGSNFARFGPNDPSLLRYRYPKNFIGQTIYVKLPAFNTFGQSLQDLSGLVADSYTLTGAGNAPANIPFSYVGFATTTSIDVPIAFSGTPTAGTPIVNYTLGGTATFPSTLSGSSCSAGTAATANTIFDIAKNGTNWATMTFAAGASNAAFSGGPEGYAAGDVLTIVPRTTDATLAGLTGVLHATGPTDNSGTPHAGFPIARYTFDAAGSLPANLAGAVATAQVPAGFTTQFEIDLNNINFALMTFNAGSAIASFGTSAAQNFVAGDVLTITPTATDTSLAQISGYLVTA